ncbi:MAG: ABC transporter substrate-binding protein [Verrucomicrobia bacterium]|nr:ABC transporter substrate-binding protein [Verrucomicrobiota bacterium]MDA1068469.1 ABC transporter substrate-binding protein [Verrucomicrobiota bacterium]
MKFIFRSLVTGFVLLSFACSKQENNNQTNQGLTKVTLQTDWYAQPEHGGFYQALVKGYYKEAGLDVEIIPGGPNAMTVQKVAQGVADFSLGRSDQIIVAVSRGVPLMIQGAIMQQDPQAIMFHKESGIKDFKDLDGKTIMAIPGSTFVGMLEHSYGIQIDVIPTDFGMNRFLADKAFIQQCFITNEPYYVSREGANVGTLLLSDSGFSPYRVWYTSSGYARANPEIVQAFSEASIRGWNDYLTGDRSEADNLISSSNPKQTPDFIDYVVNSMIENQLVTGDPEKGEAMGRLTIERIQKQIDQLNEIEALESDVKIDQVLPRHIREPNPGSINSTPQGLLVKLISNAGTQEMTIAAEEMAKIAQNAKMKFFATEEVEYDMTIVYLKDFLDTFIEDTTLNFWIMNCGDKYQSNFYPEILESSKPFFILTIDQKPLAQWLKDQGHPKEWGPHIVNIQNTDGLLDPPHKNPWGVIEMILTTKTQAFGNWGASKNSESINSGRDIFQNSCASCHDTGNGILGGKVSTRNLQMLAVFAKNTEVYFRKLLDSPKETNPLAEKMPSYKHYSEKQVNDLIAFLKSR